MSSPKYIEFDKKQKLISDSDEPFFRIKSSSAAFYEHHNMPWRKLIKENSKIKKETNSKNTMTQQNFYKKQINGFSNSKQSQNNYCGKNSAKYQKLFSSRKNKITSAILNNYGRNIFQKQVQINKNVGPGHYETFVPRSKSFGYIHHEQIKINMPQTIKLKLKKQALMGPGKYELQNSLQKLSNHKFGQVHRISNSNLIRTIVPTKNVDNIFLNLNSVQKKQKGNYKIGPGAYFRQKNQFVTSQYKKGQSFAISNTQRSNIINSNKLPGPGFYQWNKFFDKQTWKVKQNKKKSAIQFKFIYGHPS